MRDIFVHVYICGNDITPVSYTHLLAKENARLEKELQQVQRFMENTMIDHKPISEIYEETKREEAEKHRDDWIPSAYNER